MDSIEETGLATAPDSVPMQWLPSFQMMTAALLMAAGLAAIFTWGNSWGAPELVDLTPSPSFRYVNSGWISPVDWQELSPLATELKAFVIVSQDELDEFESSYFSKITRGNATTLGRIDFETSILLAAYYTWRPVRGDPLSFREVAVDDEQALISMELDLEPQGREYSYLYAPMVMVAVERSLFPSGEPVEFTFELEGHPAIKLSASPN